MDMTMDEWNEMIRIEGLRTAFGLGPETSDAEMLKLEQEWIEKLDQFLKKEKKSK